MNQFEARRYIACSKGNAIVAAWVSILDTHKLHPGTSVSPEEWYEAFESLYLADGVDPDVFNRCDIQKTFFSGDQLSRKQIDEAIWNLQYLKSFRPEGSAEAEDILMNKRHTDLPPPDLDDIIDSPQGLTRVIGDRSMAPMERISELLPAELPSLAGSVIEADQGRQMGALTPVDPSNDIRGLPCQTDAPKQFGRPYTETADFVITCCGTDVLLEDTGGGDWFEGDASEDFDTIDLSLHGQCMRCDRTFHLGSSAKVPKGTIGGQY